MQKTIISICVVSLLTGCATAAFDKKESAVERKVVEVEKALQSSMPKEASPISFRDGSYVPMRKLDRADYSIDQRGLLNLEVESNRNFSNLNEIASWLSTVAGTAVFINPELMAPVQNQFMPGMGLPGAPAPQSMTTTMPGGIGVQTTAAMLTAANKPFSSNYSGYLSGFLDMVAANYGVFWKLEGRNVRFLLTDSRTFRIKALPGDTQLSSLVSGASNSSGTGGTTSTTSTSTTSATSANSAGVTFQGLSVWGGIESGIKQYLTPRTGLVAVSPGTGTVTVTDTPRVLDMVAKFVDDQNAALSRQVSVNVRVLSVEVNDGDNYGINWNAVYNNLADNVAFKISSGLPVAAQAAQFVLQTSTPSAGNWGAASGAVISALSTQGKVSEITSATVTTLNNQPAPVNVGRQVSYVASSATTLAAQAGSTTTLTPGVVQTGFSMVLLPHIIDGKELMIQSSINLSSLLDLVKNESGGTSIQSPDISTSNFIQRVRMMSGDTLVMAGFDQDKLQAVAKGVGAAKNQLLGTRDSSGKRTMLVILIQPSVAL